ncbi:hypothetical protein NQZ68_034824 [Dissostichus eleginoides]|nr:hypothetical protein NQZ68_034824 [Dissostichus eleginoides]
MDGGTGMVRQAEKARHTVDARKREAPNVIVARVVFCGGKTRHHCTEGVMELLSLSLSAKPDSELPGRPSLQQVANSAIKK